MSKLPGGENLNVCEEHGVMKHSDQRKRGCPLCILDMEVEVRRGWELPGAADGDTGVKQQEIRQRIPAETLAELLPLMEEYLQDRTGEEDPALWLAVVGLDPDRDLPAGYSEAQERWINVVGYELGSRVKAVTVTGAAEETIETLRENGYGKDPEIRTDGGVDQPGSDQEEACRREGKVAASQVSDRFTQLRDRLEEMYLEHDVEEAGEAWRSVEDLYRDLDDTLAEAQEVFADE